MHFLFIQFVLILLSRDIFAAIYGSSCTSKCDIPGTICVNNVCQCDLNKRLFWTGARCLECPIGWLYSDFICIGYYVNRVSWLEAWTTCQKYQGDLISIRDTSVIPYIYKLTTGSYPGRKKRQTTLDGSIGWTSGQGREFTNLGVYQWTDPSLSKFDARSSWWCKNGQWLSGYYHNYNEPTRAMQYGIFESCLLFRRGDNSKPVLCLDDVFCDLQYPFICQRSESTAVTFFGPPPSSKGNSDGSSTAGKGKVTAPNSFSGSSTNGGRVTNRKPLTNGNNAGGTTSTNGYYPDAQIDKSKKKSKSIIIIIIIVALLFLLGIGVGVFLFMQRRNEKEIKISQPVNQIKKQPTRPPVQKNIIKNEMEEDPPLESDANEIGLSLENSLNPENLGLNIGKQKEQKSRKGIHSQQQFDEFE